MQNKNPYCLFAIWVKNIVCLFSPYCFFVAVQLKFQKPYCFSTIRLRPQKRHIEKSTIQQLATMTHPKKFKCALGPLALRHRLSAILPILFNVH